MRIRTIITMLCMLVAGLVVGWLSKAQFDVRANRAQSLLALGQAHQATRSGEVQRAIFYATQATLANPNSYLAQISLAEIYEQNGHKDLALESYREALRLLHLEGGGQGEEGTLKAKIEKLGATNRP